MNFIDTIISIAIMILLGYFLKRIDLLKTSDSATLNKIVINLGLPCMMFITLYNADLSQINILGIMPLTILVSGIIIGLITYLYTKNKGFDKKTSWTIILVCICGNTAMVGFPICRGIFGNQGLVGAIFLDLGSSLIFILGSMGLALEFGGSYKNSVKTVLRFPPLWAFLIGIFIRLSNITVAPLGINVITELSNITVPLIMLSLGLSLNFKGIRKYLSKIRYVFSIKLFLYPCIGFLIGCILNLTSIYLNVAVVEAAMPSGMIILALMSEYDLDIELGSSCIFFNTISCLITIPFWIIILSFI